MNAVVQAPATEVVAESRTRQPFDAQALISQAIERGVNVETMERLLAMRRELKAEWAKEQFDQAMAAFQSECPIISKTKAVHTKDKKEAYKYAPLQEIVEKVRELLHKHGFSYSVNQPPARDGYIKVALAAKHTAGHTEVTSIELPIGGGTQIMSKTQVEAAALTFAKRYAFCNAFGILTGDEDVDGQDHHAGNHTGNAPIDRRKSGYYIFTRKGRIDLEDRAEYRAKWDEIINTCIDRGDMARLKAIRDENQASFSDIAKRDRGTVCEVTQTLANAINKDVVRYFLYGDSENGEEEPESVYADPVEYATAFSNYLLGTSKRDLVIERNSDEISKADSTSGEAKAILQAILQVPPEPEPPDDKEPVKITDSVGGNPDYGKYLQDIITELANEPDASRLRRWIKRNRPTIMSIEDQQIRLRARSAVEQRARELGMELKTVHEGNGGQ